MTTPAPGLVARRWRSRRSAAVAGIVFAVLLIAALVMMRLAVAGETVGQIELDPGRRALVRLALNLVPFAGIAFLWFIGVVRDQLGEVEDRLFSTVFLGSGLLFLAMLFQGAVTATSLVAMVSGPDLDAGVWTFGRGTTEALVSVYAMRMAAVFTLSVSTVALRTPPSRAGCRSAATRSRWCSSSSPARTSGRSSCSRPGCSCSASPSC